MRKRRKSKWENYFSFRITNSVKVGLQLEQTLREGLRQRDTMNTIVDELRTRIMDFFSSRSCMRNAQQLEGSNVEFLARET